MTVLMNFLIKTIQKENIFIRKQLYMNLAILLSQDRDLLVFFIRSLLKEDEKLINYLLFYKDESMDIVGKLIEVNDLNLFEIE